MLPARSAGNVNVRGCFRDSTGWPVRLDCSCFHDWRVGLIHPIKRKLAGGYVERHEADDMGGEGGEDESQIWSKVMRLAPYQGEHTVDLSPLSHVHPLSDFDLCSSKYLALSWNNGAQCARLHLTDLFLDNSRRLLVCRVVCPAVWRVWPPSGL